MLHYSYCDDTLVEAVSTLIWASPRLVADVQEFGIVSVHLKIGG